MQLSRHYVNPASSARSARFRLAQHDTNSGNKDVCIFDIRYEKGAMLVPLIPVRTDGKMIITRPTAQVLTKAVGVTGAQETPNFKTPTNE